MPHDMKVSSEILGGDAALAESTAWKARKKLDPRHIKALIDATDLFEAAMSGNRRAMLTFQEALSTSDFPILLGTIFGRELMATYQMLAQVWPMFATRSVVNDFRPKSIVDILGGRAVFEPVAELAEYPGRKVTEAGYSLKVGKFGARIPISWEDKINDDLDGLRDLPLRLAQGAADTEDWFATAQIATAAGPNTAFFKAANGNAPTALPLTVDNLIAAYTAVTSRKDNEGRPLSLSGFVLVVPPGLDATANNIMNATEIRVTEGNKTMITNNWLGGKFGSPVVNQWLTTIDVSAKAATTWYILPAPATLRPAVAVGFLRGHEAPDVRVKADTGQSLSGVPLSAEDGDFDSDGIQYRCRHIIGGTTMDPIGTYVSLGS
jgi:Mu-like prophage major head subunit gpT